MAVTTCLNGRNCTGEILSWLKSDNRVVPSLLEKACFCNTASSVICFWWIIKNEPFNAFEKEEVVMLLKTQAATEIARFLANHPTPEQIVACHPSSEVAERAYELIHTERDSSLTEEERQELESYLVIEYLMELVKLEAQRQLRPQAS